MFTGIGHLLGTARLLRWCMVACSSNTTALLMGQGVRAFTDLTDLELYSILFRQSLEADKPCLPHQGERRRLEAHLQACAHSTWRGLHLRELGSDSCRQSHFMIDRKFGLFNKNASF